MSAARSIVLVLLAGACTRSSSDRANPAGSSAVPAPSEAAVAPQISSDAPDPVVTVDAAAQPDNKPDAAAQPDKKPDRKLVQCSTDTDCVMTMIPAEPACCRQLCAPRAVPRATLPGLEAKQSARDCKAVLCAPPAPCPRPRAMKPACQHGACVAI